MTVQRFKPYLAYKDSGFEWPRRSWPGPVGA